MKNRCQFQGWVLFCLVSLFCSACSNLSRDERIGAGVAALAAGTYLPSTALEQVYYLGVFDPQEQISPTIYRVRVKGQAGFLNTTRYASGWVPAEIIDSLSSTARFENVDSKGATVSKVDDSLKTALTGRRLVMFGPEGFREAPKNHRLVITMGSSPEKFFQAVDEALGVVAAVTQGQSGPALEKGLFTELLRVKSEHEKLDQLNSEASNDRLKEQ